MESKTLLSDVASESVPTEQSVHPCSGAEWVVIFEANAGKSRPIPWEEWQDFTAEELAAISRSLQGWQLGETSDGRHLWAAAAKYARRIGDPAYLRAVEFFICEEQRHGELLGQVLDRAGVGRRTADWGDRLFRIARYCLTDMEVWTTPVVMVETIALVYYNAIRRATRSPVLRAVCAQILADEVPHLRFQCERLASLYRKRSRAGYAFTLFAQRIGFRFVTMLVWLGHRKALRAGGYDRRRFFAVAWRKMMVCWKWMDPRRYAWGS